MDAIQEASKEAPGKRISCRLNGFGLSFALSNMDNSTLQSHPCKMIKLHELLLNINDRFREDLVIV